MTVAVSDTAPENGARSWLSADSLLLQFVAAIVIGIVISLLFSWAHTWPDSLFLPVKQWLSDFFA